MASRPFMNNFRILRLPYELTSNSGLALISQFFKLMRLDQHVDPAFPVRDTAISVLNSDILKSYLGLLVQGKTDFDAIETYRDERFFAEALGIRNVPSSPTLRQRMDTHAAAWFLLLDSLNPQLAGVAGASSVYLEYFFAVLLTLSIVVSLKIIGALLVEALVLVPAAAARNIATSTRGYLVWSVVVAFLAGIGGLGVSTRLLVPTGGAVVLAVSAIFFITLAIARLRTRRVS